MGATLSSSISSYEVTETDSQRYRREANEAASKWKEFSAQSRTAWSCGDKARAKELSNSGKQHQARMMMLNRRAADVLYEENNAHRDENTMDLHGLHVKVGLLYCLANNFSFTFAHVTKGGSESR